jgi:hypothetical protein
MGRARESSFEQVTGKAMPVMQPPAGPMEVSDPDNVCQRVALRRGAVQGRLALTQDDGPKPRPSSQGRCGTLGTDRSK